MNLRQFYKKIRDVEASIEDLFPLIASVETSDGGKPGVVAEVPRYQAARQLVEGKARLASEEEKELYRDQCLRDRNAAEEWSRARRLQLDLLLNPEPRSTPAPVKSPKK